MDAALPPVVFMRRRTSPAVHVIPITLEPGRTICGQDCTGDGWEWASAVDTPRCWASSSASGAPPPARRTS